MTQYDTIVDKYTFLIESAFPKINAVIDGACESCMEGISGKIVLDVPCGDGRYSQMLVLKGASRIVGLDVSEEMIRTCRAMMSSPRASFFCGDVAHFDFSLIKDAADEIQKYDAIFTFALWHYLPDLASLSRAVRNLTSCLKKGGSVHSLILDSKHIPCESQILSVWGEGPSQLQLKDGDYINWNYRFNEEWLFPQNIRAYFWQNATLRKIFEQNNLVEIRRYNLLDIYAGFLTEDEVTSLRVWSMWELLKPL